HAGEMGKNLAAEYGISRAAISFVRSSTTWHRPSVERGMHESLTELSLIGHKHIPAAYQHASVDQRLALLQGLMDTDGSITRFGYAEFCSISQELADGVEELCTGLGLMPRMRVDRARLYGVDTGPRYRVCFTPTDLPVF